MTSDTRSGNAVKSSHNSNVKQTTGGNTMTRPTVTQVRRYTWFDGDTRIEGIGLLNDRRILFHLTPAEALQIANDIADTLQELNQ